MDSLNEEISQRKLSISMMTETLELLRSVIITAQSHCVVATASKQEVDCFQLKILESQQYCKNIEKRIALRYSEIKSLKIQLNNISL